MLAVRAEAPTSPPSCTAAARNATGAAAPTTWPASWAWRGGHGWPVPSADDLVERVGKLRDRLASGLAASVPGLVLTGEPVGPTAPHRPGPAHRRASATCASKGSRRESLLVPARTARGLRLGRVVVRQRRHGDLDVLAAMGVDPGVARGACGCRWAGRRTEADVDLALEAIPAAVARLRRFRAVKLLVAMSGGVDSSVAAALLVARRPRRHRGDLEAVGRRQRHRVLLGGRRGGRPAGGRPAGHRPPCLQLRRRLRGPGGRALRRRPPPGPHAQPVHRVQPPPQVRPPGRAGPTPLGFDGVATGHHARLVVDRSGPDRRLARGADSAKDQSYVLYVLDPELLARIWLPGG